MYHYIIHIGIIQGLDVCNYYLPTYSIDFVLNQSVNALLNVSQKLRVQLTLLFSFNVNSFACNGLGCTVCCLLFFFLTGQSIIVHILIFIFKFVNVLLELHDIMLFFVYFIEDLAEPLLLQFKFLFLFKIFLIFIFQLLLKPIYSLSLLVIFLLFLFTTHPNN